jgi:hypothetical protein
MRKKAAHAIQPPIVISNMISIFADYRLPRTYTRMRITTISRMIPAGMIRILKGLSNRSPNIMR